MTGYYDRAFAPFGETYNNYGNSSGNNFTGDTQDTISGTYDTPSRELNPNQGRWISSDPAGLGAVDFSNPQSWNRYGYVGNNPLNLTDPSGLVVPLPVLQDCSLFLPQQVEISFRDVHKTIWIRTALRTCHR